MPTALSINVLGNVTASLDDRPVGLGGRRQRAVLAALVLARGASVTSDQIIESVWGGDPPPAAVSALHAYVSRLRRELDPTREARGTRSVISSVGQGYALRVADDAVDAWRFEASVEQVSHEPDPQIIDELLTRALDLWRGPAYTEFSDKEWTRVEQARLTELREAARETRAAARLALGRHSIAVPELEAMVAATPLREERWRLLALALYRSGRQSEALSALRRARQVLADEVGVDPGPALRALEDEVLAQQVDPADGGRARPSSSPGITREQIIRRTPPADPLVDRDDELGELGATVQDALGGEARMVLLEGPAGIGKTRLLAEARRLAGQHLGVRILSARGSQLEKEYGYGVVRQLFEPVVTAADGAALLSGAAAPAGAVFDLLDPSAMPPDSGLRVVHGLYRLTVNLTEVRGVVLCFDDLQWCDSASLRFLTYLVHRAEGLPLIIVGTVRTGERHDDDHILNELAEDPIAVRIRPRPLSRAGVGDVVRAQLGSGAEDEFIAACYEATSGNPLLLRQLIRAIASERVAPDAAHAAVVTAIGSRAVSNLVLTRLARLPADCTAVAQAVAVFGGAASLPTVAALADMDEAAAGRALARLISAEILRETYPLAFVHPLVAEAVYKDIPAGVREVRHDRAAHLLHDLGLPLEQVAGQLLQVPPRGDPWVVDLLRQAAARTRERAAPDAAAVMLRRALLEPPPVGQRADLLLELGQAEAISNAPAAQAHLREAYDLSDDPAATTDLALTLARILVFVGPRGDAARFAHEAAGRLPAGLVDERAALLATERISGYLHDLDPALWRHSPLPEVVGSGPGARMLAVALAWEAVIDGVDRARAVELTRFAVADTTLLIADTGLLWVVAGHILELCDEDSAPLWSAGLVQARQRGDLFTTLGMQLWRGWMLWGRGDLREAHQVLLAGTEMSHDWGAAGGLASGYGESFMLGVLIDRGDLRAARAYAEQIRPHHRFAEGARLFGHLQSRLLAAEGRHQEALDSIDEVADLMATVENPAWRPWRSARAVALVGLGRRAEAVELSAEDLRLARRWGTPRAIGRALRLHGQLRGVDGQADLREAAALLAGGRAQVELARVLLALARLDPPGETVGLLRQVLALAEESGADALYRAAAKGLSRQGFTVPAEPAALSTLSGTERRIAALHVEGVDPREIAERLHLTPRSVRSALETVSRRLGTRSRDELRQAIGGLRPPRG